MLVAGGAQTGACCPQEEKAIRPLRSVEVNSWKPWEPSKQCSAASSSWSLAGYWITKPCESWTLVGLKAIMKGGPDDHCTQSLSRFDFVLHVSCSFPKRMLQDLPWDWFGKRWQQSADQWLFAQARWATLKTVTSLNKEARFLKFRFSEAIIAFGDIEPKCSKCYDRKAKIAFRTSKCCNR